MLPIFFLATAVDNTSCGNCATDDIQMTDYIELIPTCDNTIVMPPPPEEEIKDPVLGVDVTECYCQGEIVSDTIPIRLPLQNDQNNFQWAQDLTSGKPVTTADLNISPKGDVEALMLMMKKLPEKCFIARICIKQLDKPLILGNLDSPIQLKSVNFQTRQGADGECGLDLVFDPEEWKFQCL